MSIRTAAAALTAALALASAGSAAAHSHAPTLSASVGPDFTIALAKDGKKVSKLKAGTYKVVVKDRSAIHDFHLKGPGVNKVLTAVGFTGTKTVTITLKKGSYTFVCDPHAHDMHGAFKVA
jgi:plastocyanin